jgi:Ca-activated chloride channel homolog
LAALLAVIAAVMVASGSAEAQGDGASGKPNDARVNNQPPQAKNPIRARVNEVIVPVTVTDKKGEDVLDLTQPDFQIFDKGMEQKVERFDIDADPLAVALVVESSSHIQAMAPIIQGMGTVFTETVMALSGEAAVITYDTTVDVRQQFTQDHDAVEKTIAGIQFEAPQEKLYDGMAKAVELLKEQPAAYRKIMLVVGESADYDSHANLRDVVREAQLANILIYAVGPSSTSADLRYGKDEQPGDRPPPSVKLPKLPPIAAGGDYASLAIWLLSRGTNEVKNHQLEVAAASTGGIHYRALHQETIRKAIDRIGGELHAQYVLAYQPSGEISEGFNEIKVTVSRSNVTVRTRPGYFAAAQ